MVPTAACYLGGRGTSHDKAKAFYMQAKRINLTNSIGLAAINRLEALAQKDKAVAQEQDNPSEDTKP